MNDIANKKGNTYFIEGDSVRIEFELRDGTVLNGYIDLDDLKYVLIDFRYTWRAHWSSESKAYYVESTIYLGNTKPVNFVERLHIFLLNPEHNQDVVIDHINGNTLDNRRSNLRPAWDDTNSMNRTRLNCNNKTGYRNVMFDIRKKKKPYIVQLQINGKNKRLGSFNTPEEANSFAEEMRFKYYGEFAGENNLQKKELRIS